MRKRSCSRATVFLRWSQSRGRPRDWRRRDATRRGPRSSNQSRWRPPRQRREGNRPGARAEPPRRSRSPGKQEGITLAVQTRSRTLPLRQSPRTTRSPSSCPEPVVPANRVPPRPFPASQATTRRCWERHRPPRRVLFRGGPARCVPFLQVAVRATVATRRTPRSASRPPLAHDCSASRPSVQARYRRRPSPARRFDPRAFGLRRRACGRATTKRPRAERDSRRRASAGRHIWGYPPDARRLPIRQFGKPRQPWWRATAVCWSSSARARQRPGGAPCRCCAIRHLVWPAEVACRHRLPADGW